MPDRLVLFHQIFMSDLKLKIFYFYMLTRHFVPKLHQVTYLAQIPQVIILIIIEHK